MWGKNNKIKAVLSDDKGNVTVIIAICMVVFLMFATITVDVGSLYEERRSLQTVADSAALAGVQELPEDPDGAVQKAIEYSAKHGKTISSDDVIISSTLAENDTITVSATNSNTPLYFAKVIGQNSANVGATAKAVIASPSEYIGVVPWGVPDQPLNPGQEYVLKYGSGPGGESYCGNFQALALDSPGGNEYRNNIFQGASTPLMVGDIIKTQTGNQVANTEKGVKNRINSLSDYINNSFEQLTQAWVGGYRLLLPDSQFIMVPIIPELTYATGGEEVEILRFAPFIITDIQDMHDDSEFGNGVAVVGRFLSQALIVTSGGITSVDSGGIRVIRLIQ